MSSYHMGALLDSQSLCQTIIFSERKQKKKNKQITRTIKIIIMKDSVQWARLEMESQWHGACAWCMLLVLKNSGRRYIENTQHTS